MKNYTMLTEIRFSSLSTYACGHHMQHLKYWKFTCLDSIQLVLPFFVG